MKQPLSKIIKLAKKIKDIKFFLPKSINKGTTGILFEELAGIKKSSDCLDCEDGEIKTYPLKIINTKNKINDKRKYIPTETIAITMIDKNKILNEEWKESRLYKKIKNILFIGYEREDNYIIFKRIQLMNENEKRHKELYKIFENDYNLIQKSYQENNVNGSIGKLIQSRTKGKGGKAKKTRAFYFRPFLMDKLDNIK